MKERPIIMSGESAKAILEDRKTQTRRVIKPQPIFLNDDYGQWGWKGHIALLESLIPYMRTYCPYGKVGDRLWVRETHRFTANNLVMDLAIEFKDGTLLQIKSFPDGSQVINRDHPPLESCWRPSIFMPRWASRILLKITGVRVERLQEITEEDAKAEGVICCENAIPDYRHHFMVLWDFLNAKRGYGWDKNPWVWIISFRRIKHENQNPRSN